MVEDLTGASFSAIVDAVAKLRKKRIRPKSFTVAEMRKMNRKLWRRPKEMTRIGGRYYIVLTRTRTHTGGF